MEHNMKMARRIPSPTLEQLQYRLQVDQELLQRHPEHADRLNRKIERDKKYLLEAMLTKNPV